MNYRGKTHEIIFKRFMESKNNAESDNATLTVAYLFSADNRLWNQTKRQLDRGSIDFGEIKLADMGVSQYTLIRAAQDLYEDTMHLSLSDLTDREVVPEKIYRLIIEAVRIRRYGVKAGDAEC